MPLKLITHLSDTASTRCFCHLVPHHDVFFSFFLCQVFTVSKDLVPRVLSRIVESVADEMCRLMQCVSSFSKNGALQVGTQSHAHTRSRRAVSHS